MDIQDRIQQKLATYKPSPATVELIKNTSILFLVGISGAGKGTITEELLKTGQYHLIISHTTRQPRVNNGLLEQDGREYHFITLEQAEQMLDNGSYVEAKMYSGNVYGTSAAEIQAAHDTGKIATTDIEVQGVAEYMKISSAVKAVFVLPPSFEVWQERLLKRYEGNVDQTDYDKRMNTALQELEHALSAPYFSFVVNGKLGDAVSAVHSIATGTVQDSQAVAQARATAQQIVDSLRSAVLS